MDHRRPHDLRLHDLHPRHARAGVAGPDRPRLHRRATGGTRRPAACRIAPTGRRAPPTTSPTRRSGLVDQRPRAGRPRVRPLPPAGLHLAHLHARVGRRPRHRRGHGRRLAGRAPLQGRLRHRGGRRRRGQADRRPRRLRPGQPRARGCLRRLARRPRPASRPCSRPARRSRRRSSTEAPMISAHSSPTRTYIEATPERVWRALTDRADTRRFWRHRTAGGKTFPSDWKKGSTWDLVHEDVGRRRPRPRAGHPRVRPAAPAVLHVALVHARVGGGRRPPRGPGRRLAGRAPLQGGLRHRGRGARRGQAHRRPRRLRHRAASCSRTSPGLAGRAVEPEDPARDRVAPALIWARRPAHSAASTG